MSWNTNAAIIGRSSRVSQVYNIGNTPVSSSLSLSSSTPSVATMPLSSPSLTSLTYSSPPVPASATTSLPTKTSSLNGLPIQIVIIPPLRASTRPGHTYEDRRRLMTVMQQDMLEQGSKETTKLKNRLLQLQNENQRNIQLRNQSDLRATETSCRLQQFESEDAEVKDVLKVVIDSLDDPSMHYLTEIAKSLQERTASLVDSPLMQEMSAKQEVWCVLDVEAADDQARPMNVSSSA